MPLVSSRLRHRIQVVVYFFIAFCSLVHPSLCQTPSAREGLTVIFLIDCSPSAGSRQKSGEYLIADIANKLRDQVFGLTEAYDVPLYFGAVNFGGRISGQKPLARVEKGTSPSLPQREVIPYTDFRPAFKYALEELKRSERLSGSTKSIVILITDSEPWPKRRLGQGEGKAYFEGYGRFQDPSQPSLAGAIAGIRTKGTDVVVIGVQDGVTDSRLWRGHVRPENYISTRESSDPLAQTRELLTRIVEETQRQSSGPSFTTTHAKPPASEKGEGKNPISESTKVLGVLLIVAASSVAFLLWFVIKLRKEVRELTRRRFEEVERLEEHARALADEGKEVEATEVLEEALILSVDDLRKADQAGKAKILDVVFQRLEFCKTLEEERAWIEEKLEKNQVSDEEEDPREEKIARAMAAALLRRWAYHQELLLPEFNLFRLKPLGDFFLEGFGELQGTPDGVSANFAVAVQRLAKAARDLNRFVGT